MPKNSLTNASRLNRRTCKTALCVATCMVGDVLDSLASILICYIKSSRIYRTRAFQCDWVTWITKTCKEPKHATWITSAGPHIHDCIWHVCVCVSVFLASWSRRAGYGWIKNLLPGWHPWKSLTTLVTQAKFLHKLLRCISMQEHSVIRQRVVPANINRPTPFPRCNRHVTAAQRRWRWVVTAGKQAIMRFGLGASYFIFFGIAGGERRWAIDGANFPVFVSCAWIALAVIAPQSEMKNAMCSAGVHWHSCSFEIRNVTKEEQDRATPCALLQVKAEVFATLFDHDGIW